MELLDSSVLLGRASEIAEVLLASAESEDVASITWHRGFDVHREPAPDPGIYNGRAGEALFFAALAAAAGDDRYRKAALAAIAGVRRAYATPANVDAMARQYGIGLIGVGSHIYALESLSRLLGDDELRDLAGRVVQRLNADLIRGDRHLELFWGASGLLLGLLAVADSGSERALELAEECGRTLLAERVVDRETGLRAWMSYHGSPAAGFAHGAAGIGHSLIELHRRRPHSDWLEAVTEAFAFERTLLDPATGDWVDIKGLKDKQCAWCHGAAGIGFARLAAVDCLGTSTPSEIIGDLYATLQRVATYPGDPSVNLCCGAFGRADFLLESGVRLQNDGLIRHAHRTVDTVLHRTEGAAFAIPAYPETHLKPGFWQGLAGIGYEAVRLTAPDRFPSVLSLASPSRSAATGANDSSPALTHDR